MKSLIPSSLKNITIKDLYAQATIGELDQSHQKYGIAFNIKTDTL